MTPADNDGLAESMPSTQIFQQIRNHNNLDDEDQPVIIKLGLFWDEWARCIGSRYQADHLYRVGRLDSCSRQWKDFKTATRARFMIAKDPKRAKELLDTTYYQKRTTISPTAGAIWELKKKPGWN
jgi:hypothetical protein